MPRRRRSTATSSPERCTGSPRVRYVTQDDAHIFCTREQIPDELDGCLDYLRYLYGLFGIEPHAELSTRPDNKLGSDEEWDFTEAELLDCARSVRRSRTSSARARGRSTARRSTFT